MTSSENNAARRLAEIAKTTPDNVAIAVSRDYAANGKRRYETIAFQQLDEYADKIAYAFRENGVKQGMRIALLAKYGIDFIALVYAIFKSGAVVVLVDPGMGMRRMLNCLAEAEPDGFAALSPVHAVRIFLRSRFPKAKHHLIIGRRWFWGGLSLEKIKRQTYPGTILAAVEPDDPAAIIFTSGSTGVPKGVLYTHQIINTQASEIAARYGIRSGIADVAGFPFFGLFDAAMGVTAVIPDMNPTRPADVNPKNILEAAADWNAVQSFGSPALWNRVADDCIERNVKIPTLRRVVLAGAPISTHLLAKLKRCLADDAEIFTPYGATESLPVASIEAKEILNETAALTNLGLGICVGKRFSQIDWRIVKISDAPIERLEDAEILPAGEIGELAVTGPQVTRRYITRVEANAASKMIDSQGRVWHRIGDVGHLDAQERFWFCGRKAHRVETATGVMFTIPCEAIFNMHADVYRTALIGLGKYGEQTPLLCVEPKPKRFPETSDAKEKFLAELREIGLANPLTANVEAFEFLRNFPVDVRHNAKINRELLREMFTKKKNIAKLKFH
ncbi:MAG: AMP-binding protein [Planctomycetaceae bacterium]|jgi:acyl-CoA synthetase (AMP-forming)/AMP-acid ligase II|nr:AMP-binding protein [Planctomycetaceae bacterium]